MSDPKDWETEFKGVLAVPTVRKEVCNKPRSTLFSDVTTPMSDVHLFMGRLDGGLLDCALCDRKAKGIVSAPALISTKSAMVKLTRSVNLAVCIKCQKNGTADAAVAQLAANWKVADSRESKN